MLEQKFFIEQFILIIVIAFLNYLAIQFHLYWTFAWFDILMHFLGGVWVAFLSLWFFFFSGFTNFKIGALKNMTIFSILLLSVIIVGILWEVFEIHSGVLFFEKNYAWDTSLDLLMDTIGGVSVFIYAKQKLFI